MWWHFGQMQTNVTKLRYTPSNWIWPPRDSHGLSIDEYRSRAVHEFMSSILQPHNRTIPHTKHAKVNAAKLIGTWEIIRSWSYSGFLMCYGGHWNNRKHFLIHEFNLLKEISVVLNFFKPSKLQFLPLLFHIPSRKKSNYWTCIDFNSIQVKKNRFCTFLRYVHCPQTFSTFRTWLKMAKKEFRLTRFWVEMVEL